MPHILSETEKFLGSLVAFRKLKKMHIIYHSHLISTIHAFIVKTLGNNDIMTNIKIIKSRKRGTIKMKKILQIMMVTVMMVLCMTGCGKEQDEFVDYMNGNAKKEITELESKAKDSYASVTGDNYKDDETMLQELCTNTAVFAKQTVDKATALGETLEGEQLKKVHEICVNSLKDFQSVVEKLIQALESGNAERLNQINDTLDKANQEGTRYQEELKKLAEELGVEIVTK